MAGGLLKRRRRPFAFRCDARLHKVDSQATGNNTGTNWANAFPNFGSISWANIQPGAMIWIAPGAYSEIVYVGASGTSDAPITLKLATTNSPRAGQAQLTLAQQSIR